MIRKKIIIAAICASMICQGAIPVWAENESAADFVIQEAEEPGFIVEEDAAAQTEDSVIFEEESSRDEELAGSEKTVEIMSAAEEDIEDTFEIIPAAEEDTETTENAIKLTISKTEDYGTFLAKGEYTDVYAKVNGQTAYLTELTNLVPESGICTEEAVESTDQTLIKLLYYGYLGAADITNIFHRDPANTLSKLDGQTRHLATAFAIANLMNDADSPYSPAKKDGRFTDLAYTCLETFTEYVKALPDIDTVAVVQPIKVGEETLHAVYLKDAPALNFTIDRIDLEYASIEYSGDKASPKATVNGSINGKTFVVPEYFYEKSDSDNVDKGTAKVAVTCLGKFGATDESGKYIVTKEETYKITAKKISKDNATVTFPNTKMGYTGTARTQTQKTTVDVNMGDSGRTVSLVRGTDFKVTYENNIMPGKATLIVTGKGNFTGTVKKTFKITCPISKCEISGIKNMTYTGKEITLPISIKLGDVTLTEGTNYTVAYTNNKNIGEATVVIKGKGYYTDSVKNTFKIQKKVSELTVSGITALTYNGKAQKQANLVVKDGSKTLTKGTDYSLSYENNIQAGTASVKIKGKGNYKGSVTRTFTIKKAKLTSATIPYESVIYNTKARKQSNGTVVKAGSTVLTYGTDYSITYKDNTDPGTATMTIKGKGSCEGTLVKTFTITKYPITSKDVVISFTEKEYTGKAIKPTVTVTAHYKGGTTVKLKKDEDYTVSYLNNTKAGNATVVVKGIGDFHTGTINKTFKIKPVTIQEATLKTTSYVYNGAARKPSPVVKAKVNGTVKTLKKDTDYTLTYSGNKNAGTAKITVKGKGNFTGTKTVTFTIKAVSLSKASAVVNKVSCSYTGIACTPTVTVTMVLNNKTVTLKKNTDYTLSYKNNINVGTASVTITGKGNFSGTITKDFQITQRSLSEGITVSADTKYVMAKSDLTPDVLLKTVDGKLLTNNTDYTIRMEKLDVPQRSEYPNRKLVMTGKGNYKGTLEYQYFAMEKEDFSILEASTNRILGGINPAGLTPLAKEAEPKLILRFANNDDTRLCPKFDKGFTVTYSGTGTGVSNPHYARIKGTSKQLQGFDLVVQFYVKP